MPWVPVDQSALALDWEATAFGAVSAGSVSYEDSTLTFANVSNTPSAPWAYAIFQMCFVGVPLQEYRFRVVCTEASGEWWAMSDPYLHPTPPDGRYVFNNQEPAPFDKEFGLIEADSNGRINGLTLQWGAGSGGTLFVNTNMTFVFYVWEDDPDPDPDPGPDPEPGASCFWTDFERTREDCTPAGESPGDVSFLGGAFSVVIHVEEYSEDACNPAFNEALLAQPDVRLTGYFAVGTVDDYPGCGDPVPATPFIELDEALEYSWDSNFGGQYRTGGSTQFFPENNVLYFVRVVVAGGATYYGTYVYAPA